MSQQPIEGKKLEVATLATGCFWCTEAAFSIIEGVERIEPGYTGGTVPNPSYEQVSTGTTGHAEAAQILFDPKVIRYKEILEIFFTIHDPTSLNRQGADAIEVIPTLHGPFDFAFIDAEKTEYLRYLQLAEPKLRSGTIVFADNAGIFADQMSNYLDYVRRSGNYRSRYVQVGDDGVEISVKLQNFYIRFSAFADVFLMNQ